MIRPDDVTNPVLPAPVMDRVIDFVQVKGLLLKGFGQSRDAMHVHIGLALFLALWLALRQAPLRWRRRWWLPFAVLAAISLLAEVADVAALVAVKSPVDPLESVRDVAATLGWPAVLSLLLRRVARP